jgi:Cache domain
MSISRKIFLGFVLAQLASAALVLGWYFYSLQVEIGDLTRRNAQEAVLRSIAATEEYFLPAETVAQAGVSLLANDVLSRDRPDQLERYFFEQLSLWPQIAGLYVGYPDGSFFYVMRSDQEAVGGTRTKVIRQHSQAREVELTWRDADYSPVKSASDPEDPYDPRERSWYRDAVDQQGSIWTKPYIFFTSRKPGITLATAIARQDGTLAAVLGVDIEMSEISSFLTRSSLGIRGSAYIATAEGEVIAHSGVGYEISAKSPDDDSLRFRNVSELTGIEGLAGERILARVSEQSGANLTGVSEEEDEGQGYFVAIGEMANIQWPWQIAVIVPKTRQIEVGRASNLFFIGIILLATTLACAIGYALSRHVGRSLRALQRNAKLARNGNVEVMEKIATGSQEIDETAEILHDFATQRRREGTWTTTASTGKNPVGGSDGR